MKNIVKTILIFSLISVLQSTSGYAQVSNADSLALVKLYNNTGGDFWTNNSNWKTTANVGDWFGVNVSFGRVYQVELQSNNLVGQIPTEIGDLTALERLNLSGNTLSGNVPPSIGNLTDLNYLNFSWNDYTNDSFPNELNQLVNLEILDLTSCNLTAVPVSVFDLTTLTNLYLGYNQISSVPVALENLSLLQSLNFGTNLLGGIAPPQLFKLSNLVTLDLSKNGFIDVPNFITDMTWLESLNLWGNELDEVDMSSFGNLVNLELLQLNGNLFTTIPDEITSLTSLMFLHLSSNQISNSGMGNLSNLINLQTLGLNGNLINEFPPEIWNLSKLTSLNLSYNHIGGLIPSDISSLPHLQIIYLHQNQLEGAVPQEVADLNELNTLYLNNNNLDGLPAFNSSNGFWQIKVENNHLTFEDIELNLAVATQFTYAPQQEVGMGMDTVLAIGEVLTLSVSVGGDNNIYKWFKDDTEISTATAPNLTVQLDTQEKYGTYKLRITNSQAADLELWSLPFILRQENLIEQDSLALVAFYNALDGPNWANQGGWITLPILNWSGVSLQDNRVVEIQMEGNRLKGQLPVELGELSALKFLQLNNNELLGNVPSQILNLTELEQLHIQFNQLDGIPNLQALSKLNTLKLEHNKFVFEDIEPNKDIASIFSYAPQDSLDIGADRTMGPGANLYLETPTPSTNNFYYWSKDGTNVGGNLNPLEILSVDYNDTGIYTCTVVNSELLDLSLNLKPVHVVVQGPPQVVYNLDELSTPRTVEIPFGVNPGGLATSVTIDYGVTMSYGLQKHWEEEPLQGSEFINTSMVLTDLDPGQSYQYQITVTNNAGSDSSPDQTFYTQDYPAVYNFGEHISLPEHGKASDYEVNDYRLFGLPGSSDFPVGDLFGGKMDEDWVVYWDNGNSSDYYQKFDGSNDFICNTGKAFWVLSLHGIDINRDINRAPLNGLSEADISLHSGWNLITNPFDQIVAWGDVMAANDLEGSQLFDFHGSFGSPGQLDPFEGYLFNPPSNMTHLKIPYPGGGITSALDKSVASVKMDWEVNLVLESDGFSDATTRFGVCNDLAENQIVNHKKPRAMGEILNIYFEHPEWDELEPAFVTDFRPADAENQSWEITTQLFSGKKATLRAINLEQVPPEMDVYLIQREKGKYWDLRKQDEVSFVPSSKVNKFEIVVGANDFVQNVLAAVVPTECTLSQNYPNPFNPSTAISYQLSAISPVELTIYNALGQKVKTVVNRTQEAGNYSVRFDGSNLASGVYYYRLTISEFTQTRKMILIR